MSNRARPQVFVPMVSPLSPSQTSRGLLLGPSGTTLKTLIAESRCGPISGNPVLLIECPPSLDRTPLTLGADGIG